MSMLQDSPCLFVFMNPLERFFEATLPDEEGIASCSSVMLPDPATSFNGWDADYYQRDSETPLNKGFVPGEWDVICGRGKFRYDHVGNRRLRVIIAMNLAQYAESKNRIGKTMVVNAIVAQIREASPLGGFVKMNAKGDYVEIGIPRAREKVGHALRDSMAEPLRHKSQATDAERRSSLKKAENDMLQSCLPADKSGSETFSTDSD